MEPILNQHRLVVDRSVIEWDFKSNPDAAPGRTTIVYALLPNVTYVREKGAVKHDDRLDALAQGVKYYTDAMAISAYEAMKVVRQEDWNDMNEAWLDDPQQAANHMAFGMNLNQRRKARELNGKSQISTWI